MSRSDFVPYGIIGKSGDIVVQTTVTTGAFLLAHSVGSGAGRCSTVCNVRNSPPSKELPNPERSVTQFRNRDPGGGVWRWADGQTWVYTQ